MNIEDIEKVINARNNSPAHDMQKALEELGIEPLSSAVMDGLILVVGHINILGYDVTTGVKLEQIQEDGMGLTFKCAICSEEDTYDEDLGADITIGRLMRAEGQSAAAIGDLEPEDVVTSFTKSKLEQLQKALETKVYVKNQIHKVQILGHEAFSDRLEGLV